jgi:O-antigen/teichoic acid export membrane protein
LRPVERIKLSLVALQKLDRQLFRRLLKSFTALFAGQLLNVVGTLVSVPLFLSHWSPEVYGEWTALSAVVIYLGFADLGMNSAAANTMTAAYARGDLKRYRGLQASALVFYVGIACCLSVLFVVLANIFPVARWLGIRAIPNNAAVWALCLLALNLLWQMPAAQIGTVYRTIGNLAATQWFGNLRSIGQIVLTVAVLLLNRGVVALAFSGLIPMVLVLVGAWLALRRSHPELLPRLSAASYSGMRELALPSFNFGLIMLCTALNLQGPVLIASRALGGTAVALLTVTRTLSNIVRTVVIQISFALWPEITRLDATGNVKSLQTVHRFVAVTSTAICTAFAAALWFEGADVIRIWTRGLLIPDASLLRAFLVALVLQTPWVASSMFTIASNQHKRLSYLQLIAAIISLLFILFLIPQIGVVAVPLGIIAGEALVCYHFVIQDTCRVVGEDYSSYAVHLWRGTIAIALGALISAFIGHQVALGPPVFKWIEVGMAAMAGSFGTAFAVGIRRTDRIQLFRWAGAVSNSCSLVKASPRV